jgi:hypothetical protein
VRLTAEAGCTLDRLAEIVGQTTVTPSGRPASARQKSQKMKVAAWDGRILCWEWSRASAHADFLTDLKRGAVGPAPGVRVPLVDLGLGHIVFLLPYTAV